MLQISMPGQMLLWTSMLRKLMGKCCCVVSDKSQFKIEMYEKNGENI